MATTTPASQQECDSGRLPGKEVNWEGCAVDSTSVKVHPHVAGMGIIIWGVKKESAAGEDSQGS